jgi:hypothetical protein
LLTESGLTDIKVTVGARRQRDPFTVLIASGVKHTRNTKRSKDTKDR